ncbi:MAG: membrane protein [Phycisphaeraceae bacterium]|nr:MAG: membrane protein [Phycisphaeraceae bacterium]
MPFTRVLDLIERVGSYPWWEVLVEFALIWVVVYAVVRFVQGTRAAGALKGLLALIVIGTIIVRILGGEGSFERIGYLYDRALALIAIALVVVFQPELRRALIRLGEASWFRGTQTDIEQVAGDITTACVYLSKSRFGALIVVERTVGLRSLIEGGTELNADLTARLLQTIFYPGSALHDLAVVIRGRKVWAAGVQLPMADPSDMPDPTLGSRHRAAVGISKDSDAIVIVVSEESGLIRMAERGVLGSAIPADRLEQEIAERLGADEERPDENDDEGETFDASEPGTMIDSKVGARGASQITTITDRSKEAG